MPGRVASPSIAGALALAVAVAIAPPARAATFTVTQSGDAGSGSLREAVAQANASGDFSNTIVFQLAPDSTIALVSPLDESTTSLLLDASGAPGLVIDGAGGAFLEASFGSDLDFQGVSWQNGRVGLGFATLTLGGADSRHDTAFATDVLFSVDLRVAGPGTATLDGVFNFPGIGGAARIEAGTLDVRGALRIPTLQVLPGGTLAGTTAPFGTVSSDVSVEGRVAPSTATGVLNVQGDLVFESGSLLDLDLLASTSGDRVSASSGTVTIASDARVEFFTQPSDFAGPVEHFDVLTSDAAIGGAFVLGTDYAFLTETLSMPDPNTIRISLEPNGLSLADFAFTPNQQRVVAHLEAAAPGATGDLAAVLAAIDRSSTAELPELYDAIGGEALTAFASGRQILGERTARALHRRTRDAAWGEGSAFYAARVDAAAPAWARRPVAPRGVLAALGTPLAGTLDVAAGDDAHAIHPDPVHTGGWLDAFGVQGDLEGEVGEADLETILYGGTLGFDVWLAERLLLGLAAGYARSDLDPDERDVDITGDTIQGAAYVGYTDPRGFLSAYGRYAYSFQDSTRRIDSSQLRRTARARFDAEDYGAGAEAGITLISLGSFALQPIAGIDWLRLTEERYTEKSAGVLGLDVDPEDQESVTARFGGRIFGKIDLDGAGELVPELRAFWQRELGDTERVLEARLSGAPGLPALGVRGPEMPRDVLLLGVGWSTSVAEQLQILLDYDALLDADRVEHQGNLALRVRF